MRDSKLSPEMKQAVVETNIRIINTLQRLIPLKVKEQNPSFTEHSNDNEEFIMDNLDMFNRFSVEEMQQSIKCYEYHTAFIKNSKSKFAPSNIKLEEEKVERKSKFKQAGEIAGFDMRGLQYK